MLRWTVLPLFRQKALRQNINNLPLPVFSWLIFLIYILRAINQEKDIKGTLFRILEEKVPFLIIFTFLFSSESERVCGKLNEERSYWTVPGLCFQCETQFQICAASFLTWFFSWCRHINQIIDQSHRMLRDERTPISGFKALYVLF